MSSKRHRSRTRLRRAVRAATALGVGSVLGLGVGLGPYASAAEPASPSFEAGKPVSVKVTQRGEYVAAFCVGDILQGRCQAGVTKGQRRAFTVKPEPGTAVTVDVVVYRGGSARTSVVANGTPLCFVSGGTRVKPTVAVVRCA